jgi:hypothetical protein
MASSDRSASDLPSSRGSIDLVEALGERPPIWQTKGDPDVSTLVSRSRCYFETDTNRNLEAEQERKDAKNRSPQA